MLVTAIEVGVGDIDDVLVVEQFHELVLRPGEIGAQVPEEIARADNSAADGQLHAGIGQHADVRRKGRISGCRDDRFVVQEVVGLGIEHLSLQIEAVIEPGRIEADVVFGGFLPLEVLGRGAEGKAGDAVVGRSSIHQVHGRPVADARHRAGLTGG